MTKKEQLKMAKLESENRHLRDQNRKHLEVYGDCVVELINLRARLELIELAVNGGFE